MPLPRPRSNRDDIQKYGCDPEPALKTVHQP